MDAAGEWSLHRHPPRARPEAGGRASGPATDSEATLRVAGEEEGALLIELLPSDAALCDEVTSAADRSANGRF